MPEKKGAKKSSAKKSKKSKTKKLAVIDFETDPFLYGRAPKPFCGGFYSEEIGFVSFWGSDCVNQLLDFITNLDEQHLIYAHNGGKFDYLYFVDRLDNPLKLINGRIAKAKFRVHEFRDSYSIIPVPLGAYQKTEIDYRIFESDVRNIPKHKKEIVDYLKDDCVYLFDLVKAFIERFGTKLTIGSTAIGELKKLTEFETTGARFDEKFRPFYYGGRVECLKKPGIHKKKFKVIDVNSMYPYVMKAYSHPAGSEYIDVSEPVIDKHGELQGYEGETYFAIIIAENDGALPFRDDTLNFNMPYAEFYATSHEIKVALKYGKLKIKKVIAAFTFLDEMDFSGYVDKFSAEKIDAKTRGDKIAELFAKLLLNSCYGKFGSNPENYYDYHILQKGDEIPDDWYSLNENWERELKEWTIHEMHDNCEIWKRPSKSKMFFNVATAASITGAARAELLDAICRVREPYYCDTDSLILSGSTGKLSLDAKRLGAWKLEAEGDTLALAGKKLYALLDGSECVKLASKGAKLDHRAVFAIAKGETIEWRNDAPNMKLSGEVKFVKRNIKRT